MKKLFVVFLFLVGLCISATAQDFKPLRLDGGLGLGIPFTKGFDAGVLFYLEPKYEIVPRQIAVGVRWEGSLFAGKNAEGSSFSAKTSFGYMATGDYYFGNKSFRPFAGLGLGAFKVNAGEASTDNTGKVNFGTNFATMLRTGFDLSHFRLTASYNHAFAKGGAFNFFGITAGFYIGGGKKNNH